MMSVDKDHSSRSTFPESDLKREWITCKAVGAPFFFAFDPPSFAWRPLALTRPLPTTASAKAGTHDTLSGLLGLGVRRMSLHAARFWDSWV